MLLKLQVFRRTSDQISFFGQNFESSEDGRYDDVVDDIKSIDLNNITPMDAMIKLKELQHKIEEL